MTASSTQPQQQQLQLPLRSGVAGTLDRLDRRFGVGRYSRRTSEPTARCWLIVSAPTAAFGLVLMLLGFIGPGIVMIGNAAIFPGMNLIRLHRRNQLRR